MVTDIILWSGGWDSTAVIVNSLIQGHSVVAVNINLECNEAQHAIEGPAIDSMYSFLKNRYSNFELRKIKLNVAFSEGTSLVQPSLWALGIALACKPRESYNHLCTGYIKGDDFWHIRSYFEECVISNLKCQGSNTVISQFWYPCEWDSKQEVYDFINKHIPELKQFIKTCESPIQTVKGYKQCGKCKKCKEQKAIQK